MADDTRRLAALSAPVGCGDFELPLSSTVRVDIAARSHRGRCLSCNEDHYLVVRLGRRQDTLATSLSSADIPRRFNEYGYAMLVADGFGTGGSGSVASRVALSAVAHLALHYGRWNLRIEPTVADEVLQRTKWLFEQASEAVAAGGRTGLPALANMATTLTAAYSAGDDLFVAHVGHSRAYLFREGHLTQLTRDHTTARYQADTGRPVAVDRRGQDLRHILTDVIGTDGEPPLVAVEHFRLTHGDCVLLCTNGLTDMVDDSRVAEVLAARRRSSEQCRTLVKLANEMGGEDNVTVVLAQYEVPRDENHDRTGQSRLAAATE